MKIESFKTIGELSDALSEESPFTLRQALVDIAERLAYNENGELDPSQSIAADSACDFVDSVNFTFESVFSINFPE